MYAEKIEAILEDIENKELEIAGGSVVAIILSSVNSLIKYISNLTIGKKKYEEVQSEVEDILEKAEILKKRSMQAIDKDKEILEKLLITYKARKEEPDKYQTSCKLATEFSLEVLKIANETYELSERISKCGNKMLSSDFKICKYYAEASIKAATENVYINLNQIEDKDFKKKVTFGDGSFLSLF